jgi:hypothetical protein
VVEVIAVGLEVIGGYGKVNSCIDIESTDEIFLLRCLVVEEELQNWFNPNRLSTTRFRCFQIFEDFKRSSREFQKKFVEI